MHALLAAVFALPAATVIDVQSNHTVTLALQFGDTIYTADFSLRDLRPDSLKEGDRVQAEVKGGHMTVERRKDGRKVSGRVIRVQRVLVHPLGQWSIEANLPLSADAKLSRFDVVRKFCAYAHSKHGRRS